MGLWHKKLAAPLLQMTLLFTQVLDCLWCYIITCWNLCNDALHDNHNMSLATAVLISKIWQIFETVWMEPTLQMVTSSQTPYQILQHPIKSMWHWVTHSQCPACMEIMLLLLTNRPHSTHMISTDFPSEACGKQSETTIVDPIHSILMCVSFGLLSYPLVITH